jgi:rRNA processing protein Gar1
MKYLGKIDDIIFNGRLIVQTTFKPPIGKAVVNKHKQRLGKITQIIGSVKKPHIIIKPGKELKTTFDLIGTNVYIA